MNASAIRKIAVGAICASLIGAAALASAGDWHGRGYHGRVISRGYGPSFGLGLGVVIGGPVYAPPVVVDPYYAPRYYGPVIEPEIVIGGGRYYHGGRYISRRGHWR